MKRENIFNSRDSSFLAAIMVATNNRGVDIALDYLIGNLLHDSFCACARFGRFVEIGKKDLTDAGRLDMQVSKRYLSSMTFDVNDESLSIVWAR